MTTEVSTQRVGTRSKRMSALLRVVALGLLLALPLATTLSAAPAGAAVPSGKAFAWGSNDDGKLGNGNIRVFYSNVPVAVKSLTGVKSVKAGCYHGLALKTDGTVYAWGNNYTGQLGNGTNDESDVPVKVKIKDVKAISAGCYHNLALKEDGSVWAWGFNRYGQLGNDTHGAGTDRNVPVKVATLGTGAKAIAAGNDFSLALMKDGTVRSWGINAYGQLGNGTGHSRDKPGPVSNLSGVKAIATDSSADHALALLNSGTVKSWGLNYYGELGDGSSLPGTDRAKPVRVAKLSGVEAIATGAFHSLALLKSGKVKSWGLNDDGELGNGTHGTDRSTPGLVVDLENVRSISGGTFHSLAILQSGKVKAWGEDYYGELGNGISGPGTYSDVPVSVKNLSNVKNIDGGREFTLAATQ